MNKVFLIGNLTKDPELAETTNGTKFCRFMLAVPRSYSRDTQDGGRETDFLPIVVWRAQAENCNKYLKKGSRAAVGGSIQTRSYDAKDGTRRYVTEIVADEVQFLSSKSDSDNGNSSFGNNAGNSDDLRPIDEDLPF